MSATGDICPDSAVHVSHCAGERGYHSQERERLWSVVVSPHGSLVRPFGMRLRLKLML